MQLSGQGELTIIGVNGEIKTVSLSVLGVEDGFAVRVLPLDGGAFAVITQQDVQLFDETLTRRGGADPLVPECAQPFNAMIVAVGQHPPSRLLPAATSPPQMSFDV